MNDTYVYGQENNAFMMYQNLINPMAGRYYDPAVMNMQQPMYGQPMQQGYQQPMYGQPQMQQPVYGGYPQQGYQPYGQQMDMSQAQQPQTNPFIANPTPVNNNVPQQQNATDTNQVTVTKALKD